MVIQRGEIWWADMPQPTGSGPGYRRPVLIVQSDHFNASKIQTVVVAVVTKNLGLAKAPGNVAISSRVSKLPVDSVINVSQVLTIDRGLLVDYVATLSDRKMAMVAEGLRMVLNL
jgi:mRNA interferase MazF